VALQVRGPRRGVTAEAAEEHGSLVLGQDAPPDATHAFPPQLNRLFQSRGAMMKQKKMQNAKSMFSILKKKANQRQRRSAYESKPNTTEKLELIFFFTC
jgi:hypothetical protein